ncbi:hypothetical protein Lal_00000038 [Lupinus albus]|nr:hypothetical protein Lal_00000038 [Lupinus albus]
MAGADLPGDHPLGQLEATPDADVEALADEVHLAIVEMPVGHDGGVAGEEVGQQRHDVLAAEHQPHAHLEVACRLAAGAGEVGHCALDGGEAAADLGEEALAGFGQFQAARTTLEQSHPQPGFQFRHVLADRRWCQAQAPCGLGKAAGLRAADEAFDAVERPTGQAESHYRRLENHHDLDSNSQRQGCIHPGRLPRIGAAIAKRLAREGAAVALTYAASGQAAEEVVKAIEAAGGRALAVKADSSDEQALRGAIRYTVDTFGRLDILVNNAGVLAVAPIEEFAIEDLDRTLSVNVRSVVIASQEAARVMGEGGRIITIGSTNAERMPFAGGSVYALSKAAVAGFTKGLARDLGPRGITVNNVQPGPVDTDMNPDHTDFADSLKPLMALPRYGQAEEIASFVAYLAGPEAGYITGANLTIDGGFSA